MTFYRPVGRPGFDPVEIGQVGIKQHSLATQDDDAICNRLGSKGNDILSGAHVFPATPHCA